ncbi:16S rRNA (adenine(1518)-N(6)/adenine(1519)-N(6))-dimethyltransferase [Wolbachia pipientis]|uniref:Ribosomal RNA small subunit methyltransferase A n=1 Tax=Wolbachia pipientis TaxID=955 RepID=A0A1E7QJC7_WOLPI|nr:16S rRNA (adenine(1518)-N(6)/adenine(1519)-N(6))-dimethyltransferase RsmA [Wolbachia pipientis]OEY86570.1 16S rRNA (adenine(1518)-N(6)/adenine(1519)-N(6))-dimethyltransferase [Wolbachia pipientis]
MHNTQMMHKPKKSLGQNFILSSHTAKKLIDLAGDLNGFNVIEIGPGYGSLTKEILKRNPKFLLAIEKDTNLIKQHDQLLGLYKGKYKIIEADALHIKETEFIEPPIKIIASLPYNISVALFLKWLDNIANFTNLTLIFQKEVAKRIVAQPHSKDYGYLSIISQLLCKVEIKFDLLPEEFFPKPKVNSSVITVNPLPLQRFEIDINALKKLVQVVFVKRRKMLKTSLKNILNSKYDIFKSAQLTGNERPEDVTIEQLCVLAVLFKN